LVQITSDIELSGAGCTTAITPNQLVQSSSENDTTFQKRTDFASSHPEGGANQNTPS
jgi:hypothetical protein